jgi:hypothetical protein
MDLDIFLRDKLAQAILTGLFKRIANGAKKISEETDGLTITAYRVGTNMIRVDIKGEHVGFKD